MDVRTIGDALEVRITFGNPAYRDLRDAGFRWNRFRKAYIAPDSPAARRALEEMAPGSDNWEKDRGASGASTLAVHHPKSYDGRDEIKRLGGRWNPDRKVWIMPDRESLTKAIEYCNALARGETPERPQIRQVQLFTRAKYAPLVKDGILVQDYLDGNPLFYRVLNTPEPSTAYPPYTDHFSGENCTELGFMWVYIVEEILGEERQRLL